MHADSVYWVTGAASGIGRRVCERLAESGARLIATDIDLEGLEAIAEERGWDAERVRVRHLDVRDAAAWHALVREVYAQLRRVDVLMNIAGFLHAGTVPALDDAAAELQIDVNLKGVVHGTRILAAHMVEEGQGHIVNVASLAAHAPVPGLALYAATKAAVRAFSLAAAQELAPSGVAVSVLCPDAVQTPMLDKQVGVDEAALTFSGTVLSVDDVASALLGPVLEERPLELSLPRHRAAMAKAANLVPGSAELLRPLLERRGRRRQKALREDG